MTESETEYLVGRTMRIERSSFANRDVPYGPAHAVGPEAGLTAECGVVVDQLLYPWPPAGPGSAPQCPDCARQVG